MDEDQLITDQPETSTSSATGDQSNPKLFKTTLCQFYLQGPCKNGDDCVFAHGTSELRTMSGVAVKEVEAGLDDKRGLKTKLCEKFLQFGSCQFGPSCMFAHGVRELQKAISSLDAASRPAENNPNYKTSLCKAYMEGHFCSFADKCQYAHGKHELRKKPEMDDELKEKLINKAKSRADYKTKICANFDKTGQCEHGEMCYYAHGVGQLRAPSSNSDSNNSSNNFKTAMCRNKDNCTFGSKCQFAHNELELRSGGGSGRGSSHTGLGGGVHPSGKLGPSNFTPTYKTSLCKNFIAGNCQFGGHCQFAHGPQELKRMGAGSFKTRMCNSVTQGTGFCKNGTSCPFAHNQYELRSSMDNMPNQFQHGQVKTVRYKTVLCKSLDETGQCARGPTCSFAHSYTEMLEAREADPKYKSMLCDNYAKGVCDKGDMCIFAHGPQDLRNQQQQMPASYFGSGGGFGSPQMMYGNGAQNMGNGRQGGGNARFKTALCQQFSSGGFCPRGDNCSFAHGQDELVSAGGQDNYKTAMCKNLNSSGSCPRGISCHFAHSADELRNPNFSNGSQQGVAGKRKQSNPNNKSVLCQNFQTFGECQNGESCTYAHSELEVQFNKRQRL